MIYWQRLLLSFAYLKDTDSMLGLEFLGPSFPETFKICSTIFPRARSAGKCAQWVVGILLVLIATLELQALCWHGHSSTFSHLSGSCFNLSAFLRSVLNLLRNWAICLGVLICSMCLSSLSLPVYQRERGPGGALLPRWPHVKRHRVTPS